MTVAPRPSVDPTVTIAPPVFYFGTPVVLLSTLMPDGSTNLTPMSSAWSLGDTYVLGLGVTNQGTHNLVSRGELVINLPDATLVENIERIAPTTGAAVVPEPKRGLYRHEPDKWTLSGLSALPSDIVAPDRVAECPVQLEARVTGMTPLNDDAVIVSAQVLRTHAHPDVVVDGTSYIDLQRWQPLYYTFRHYFAQGANVGVNFRAQTAHREGD